LEKKLQRLYRYQEDGQKFFKTLFQFVLYMIDKSILQSITFHYIVTPYQPALIVCILGNPRANTSRYAEPRLILARRMNLGLPRMSVFSTSFDNKGDN